MPEIVGVWRTRFAAAGIDGLEDKPRPGRDGSTTIENKALNTDGSVASDITTVTSADGNQRTISFVSNGDGVVDKVQTSVTVTNADDSTTETLSNANGAGVLKERFVTTTSGDGGLWLRSPVPSPAATAVDRSSKCKMFCS